MAFGDYPLIRNPTSALLPQGGSVALPVPDGVSRLTNAMALAENRIYVAYRGWLQVYDWKGIPQPNESFAIPETLPGTYPRALLLKNNLLYILQARQYTDWQYLYPYSKQGVAGARSERMGGGFWNPQPGYIYGNNVLLPYGKDNVQVWTFTPPDFSQEGAGYAVEFTTEGVAKSATVIDGIPLGLYSACDTGTGYLAGEIDTGKIYEVSYNLQSGGGATGAGGGAGGAVGNQGATGQFDIGFTVVVNLGHYIRVGTVGPTHANSTLAAMSYYKGLLGILDSASNTIFYYGQAPFIPQPLLPTRQLHGLRGVFRHYDVLTLGTDRAILDKKAINVPMLNQSAISEITFAGTGTPSPTAQLQTFEFRPKDTIPEAGTNDVIVENQGLDNADYPKKLQEGVALYEIDGFDNLENQTHLVRQAITATLKVTE